MAVQNVQQKGSARYKSRSTSVLAALALLVILLGWLHDSPEEKRRGEAQQSAREAKAENRPCFFHPVTRELSFPKYEETVEVLRKRGWEELPCDVIIRGYQEVSALVGDPQYGSLFSFVIK